MQQFDFRLTKADFDAEQWETKLASANEPTCFEFCGLLKTEMDEAKAAAQKSRQNVYTLLHAACSLSLELGDRKQPFRPAVVFETIRSAAIEDFAAGDTTVLGEIAATIKDPEVRARICDLLWVICRDLTCDDAKHLQLGLPKGKIQRIQGGAGHGIRPCKQRRIARSGGGWSGLFPSEWLEVG